MRRTLLQASLLVLLPSCAQVKDEEPGRVARNLSAVYSEGDGEAAALEPALNAFLRTLQAGGDLHAFVDPEHLRAYPFYFDGLRALDVDQRGHRYAPTLLKSYSPDAESSLVTVAFMGIQDELPVVRKIVEIKAVRDDGGYRFRCPFEERTAFLQTTTIGAVRFHHAAALDLDGAQRLVDVRDRFVGLTGAESASLDYFCFPTLDALLTAYGFIYDAHKCNFLAQDLGFLDGAERFVTGTGRADYIFGFVQHLLRESCPDPTQLYDAFVVGMAAYCGGYGLSGDDLPVLKAQFRDELQRVPDLDFLEEFQKGRSASICRHFSHYVMCAFLCEQIVERHDMSTALRLVRSGSNGERFFATLRELIGVDESNFHDAIVAMISSVA